jgi:hypothetical protein
MIEWPFEITPSKYSRWYEQLVDNARSRTLPKGSYSEGHHIIPRSLGGDIGKVNIVRLTAREHYVAHSLLWRMKLPGTAGSKMAFAFNTFINKMTTKERGIHHTYTISSRVYESFRKEYSRMLKAKYALEGGTFLGRKHSEETKRKIGEKSKLKIFKKGPDNPTWGKKRNVSPEENAKRSASIKERWADPEYKVMMQEKRRAYLATPEGQVQMKTQADARRGIARDPAIMEKCARAKRGKKEHEIYSADAILKRKEALKNRVISEEGKEKMRVTGRLVGSRPKTDSFKQKMSLRMTGIQRPTKLCEHCNKPFVTSNYNRWHGNNCKMKTDP